MPLLRLHRSNLKDCYFAGVLPPLVCTLILVTAGCTEGPNIVPVSGKVTIDGQPLTTGGITVHQAGFRTANSRIEPDGSFRLSTLAEGDGCLVGEHAVSVFAAEIIDDQTREYRAPKRYENVETSELKINIDQATDSLEIKLTWEGDPHNGPYKESE